MDEKHFFPKVIKKDGLCEGKGVFIVNDIHEAKLVLELMFGGYSMNIVQTQLEKYRKATGEIFEKMRKPDGNV